VGQGRTIEHSSQVSAGQTSQAMARPPGAGLGRGCPGHRLPLGRSLSHGTLPGLGGTLGTSGYLAVPAAPAARCRLPAGRRGCHCLHLATLWGTDPAAVRPARASQGVQASRAGRHGGIRRPKRGDLVAPSVGPRLPTGDCSWQRPAGARTMKSWQISDVLRLLPARCVMVSVVPVWRWVWQCTWWPRSG
jgi:hypothetical protein